MTTILARAYGEHFQVECKTEQDVISVKRRLKSEWLWYRVDHLAANNVPTISATDYLAN